MLRELTELFAALPPDAAREDYKAAIVQENALGKRTYATRLSSRQRPERDVRPRPQTGPLPGPPAPVAHRSPGPAAACHALCARPRPLLRSTTHPVLSLSPGEELIRSRFAAAIRESVGTRMNDAVLDKVARNAASSWAQAGHLEGRVRKIRRPVVATPGAAAMALWLGEMEGRAGLSLLDSDWAAVLDARGPGTPASRARRQASGVDSGPGGGQCGRGRHSPVGPGGETMVTVAAGALPGYTRREATGDRST